MKKVEAGGDSGAVLVYVLWVLAGLSFLALQAAALSRYRASEVRWVWEELQRREAVQSWIRLVASSQEVEQILPMNRWVSCSLGGLSFQVRRENEKGKVSLNGLETSGMRRAVEGVLGPGADPTAVDRLVDAMADWRDLDSLKRTHGAEKDEYLQMGLPAPADGPFTSVCELRLVMGVPPELLWGRPWEEAAREALAAREGLETVEAVPRSLAGSLTAVGASATRLTFLFPRSTQGYDVEIVVFTGTQGRWNLLDRCRGFAGIF